MNQNSKIIKAIPLFPSGDISASVAFYEKLGFKHKFDYDNYAGVELENFELHFWLCKDPKIAKNTSCRVNVTGVDALYEELKAKDVIHLNGHLETKPWEFKEFTIVDPDGNAIVFGEDLNP